MFKTLGLLAVSMTAAAVVLSWAQPAGPGPVSVSDSRLFSEHVRRVVDRTPGHILRRKRSIEIVVDARLGLPRALAGIPVPPLHFIVAENGFVSSGDGWNQPTPADLLLIGLTHVSGTEDVPLLQWLALRLLLAELNSRVGVQSGGRLLRIGTPTAGGRRAAQILRDLLTLQGFRILDSSDDR